MQQPALADQPRPDRQLHALQQPQVDRLIAGVELVDPATEGGAGDLGFVQGLSEPGHPDGGRGGCASAVCNHLSLMAPVAEGIEAVEE